MSSPRSFENRQKEVGMFDLHQGDVRFAVYSGFIRGLLLVDGNSFYIEVARELEKPESIHI